MLLEDVEDGFEAVGGIDVTWIKLSTAWIRLSALVILHADLVGMEAADIVALEVLLRF